MAFPPMNLALDIKQSTDQKEANSSGGMNGVNITYGTPLASTGASAMVSKTAMVVIGVVAVVIGGLYLLFRRR